MFPITRLVPFGNYSPSRIFHQHFGTGLNHEDIHIPPSFGHLHHHFPLHLLPHRKNGLSEITTDQSKYQIKLDVQHFSADELTVKAKDKCIIVEGKHEEKEDEHGYISRSFVRRYLLPADINGDDFDELVSCELSSDGILQITVQRPEPVKVDGDNAKVLPIKCTGALDAGRG